MDRTGAAGVALADTLAVGRGRAHTHRRHQLLHALSGRLVLRVGDDSFGLLPERAAWIGAGVEHAVDVEQEALLRTVYLDAAPELEGPACAVFALPALGREMIVLAQRFAGSVDEPLREPFLRSLGLLALEWAAAPLPLSLRRPRDPALVAVDALLTRRIDESVTLAAAARTAGVSTRTLSRRLREELGEGLRARHTRLRVHAALERLAAPGATVAAVAYELGFATPSAFSQAFRRLTGERPRELQARLRR